MEQAILRPQAEVRYREELEALQIWDQNNKKPQNWRLSPRAVRLFILGSPKPVRCGDRELTIRKKYLGNDALVERMDALAQNCSEEEYRRLEDIFVACSRYELGFWEMSWRLEQ